MNNITINDDGTFVEEIEKSLLIKVKFNDFGFSFGRDKDDLCIYTSKIHLLNKLKEHMSTIKNHNFKYSTFKFKEFPLINGLKFKSDGGTLSYGSFGCAEEI